MLCDIDDCEKFASRRKAHNGRPLCGMHNARWIRYGSFDVPRRERTLKPCKVDGCGRTSRGLGLCNAHYIRHKSGKPMDAPIQNRSDVRPCAVDGCDQDTRNGSSGYCGKHYARWKRHGSVHFTKLVRHRDVLCSVDDCASVVSSSGLCMKHYQDARFECLGECVVDGCDRRAWRISSGMCSMHHRRSQNGQPLDAPKRGSVDTKRHNEDGYVIVYGPSARKYGATWISEHRLVVSEQLGRSLFPWENVHHRNGIRDDNRPSNLKLEISPPRKGQSPDDLLAWCDEYRQVLEQDARWNAEAAR